jgi:hypothetical protein
VASAVINIDLPWNPAKLEQRIARAWRKNQMRSVSVINLVTEDSIENNILHLLACKQALADGVLDGAGDLASLRMPSGRAAFIERMQAMMAPRPPRIVPPEQVLVAELVERHGDRALLVEARHSADGRPRLLAVLDLDQAALAAEAARISATAGAVAVEAIDRATWTAMRRLAATGLVQFTHESRVLHRAPSFGEDVVAPVAPDRRIADLMAEADRALRMAKVLAAGGFPEEAPTLLARALAKVAAARLAERGELPTAAPIASDADIRRLVERKDLSAEALDLLDATQPSAGCPDADAVARLMSAAERVLAANGASEVKAAA